MFSREEGATRGEREGGREGELYKAHMLFLPIEKLHIVREDKQRREMLNESPSRNVHLMDYLLLPIRCVR